MFIVTPKSAYHPYDANYRSTLTTKVYSRSVLSKALGATLVSIPGKTPANRRFRWDFGEIKFNSGQKHCLKVLIRQLKSEKQFLQKMGGFAGAGKTVVLKAFVEYVRRYHRSANSCFVTAPTAMAAQLIGGVTIHSLLKFFPGQTAFKRLNEGDLHLLYEKLRHMKVLVIDEVSLLTCVMLAQIDMRLREIFGNDHPFGGISVVLFGDLLQLPAVSTLREKKIINGVEKEVTVPQCIYDVIPLRYQALYDTFTPNRKYVRLLDLFEFDELTENVRTPCKIESEILEDIRNGVESEKIKDYLYSKCRMDGNQPSDIYRELRLLRADDPNGDYMILAARNEKVNLINDWIADNSTRSIEIEPVRECPSCNTYLRYGKKKTLRLVLGGRVMISDNHTSDRSLANGVTGRLIKVTATHVVMERTDNRKIVHLSRFPYKDGSKPGQGVWYQFPVVMAEAITVHKSQGMTFDGLVLDSEGMHTPGSQYTAMSRTRSLRNVRITNVERLKYRASRCAKLALDWMRRRTAARRAAI